MQQRKEIEAFIRKALPPRVKDSHKGSYGKALLLCGSPAYTGAALLAAEGAFRMGAGLVYLYAPEEVLTPVRVRLPEVICRKTLPIAENPAEITRIRRAQREGTFLIGPGLDRGDETAFAAALAALLCEEGGALVLDADALNMLAATQDCGASLLRGARRALVLTPHPMEFARLTGKTVAEVQANRAALAAAYASECRCTLILKGADSIIASPDGRLTVNPSGSPALAKGGSGDVLAGMITGLLAQGVAPYDAAVAAAYLHGAAGEALAARYSEYGILPSAVAATAAAHLARVLRPE